MKIIVDTNLWISFIISDKFEQFSKWIILKKPQLLFSAELFDEIRIVIQKPKLKKYFKGRNAFEEMITAFQPFIYFVEVESRITICRDGNDNFLLALAKDGKADFLITGDKDLLILQQFGKTKIISFSEFEKIIPKFS